MAQIVLWIVFGALAGWTASLITNTNAEQETLPNVIVGILGATFGGFVIYLLGGSGITNLNVYSLLVSIFGAVILLFAYKAVDHR